MIWGPPDFIISSESLDPGPRSISVNTLGVERSALRC